MQNEYTSSLVCAFTANGNEERLNASKRDSQVKAAALWRDSRTHGVSELESAPRVFYSVCVKGRRNEQRARRRHKPRHKSQAKDRWMDAKREAKAKQSRGEAASEESESGLQTASRRIIARLRGIWFAMRATRQILSSSSRRETRHLTISRIQLEDQ